MKKLITLIIVMMIIVTQHLYANEKDSSEQIVGQDLQEIFFIYEYLDPNDTYGSWKQITTSYYKKLPDNLTLYYHLGLSQRTIEGNGLYLAIGAYKDWSDSLYTLSQIGASPKNEYLASLRLDHEFYYKLGEKKQWVAILGLSHINYHNGFDDWIISMGMTYYAPNYNITYRHFSNKSSPGGNTSSADLVSMGYGKEKEQWIYLDISLGNQAYQSSLGGNFVPFDEDAIDVKVTYRKWTDKNSGWFSSIGYFNLNDNYDKYLFKFGFFKEF